MKRRSPISCLCLCLALSSCSDSYKAPATELTSLAIQRQTTFVLAGGEVSLQGSLAAVDAVRIADRVETSGSVASFGDLEVGSQAGVGNVTSGGRAFLRSHALVRGDLVAQTLERQTGVTIVGEPMLGEEPERLEFDVVIDAPSGDHVQLEPDQFRHLTPGAYGRLVVKSRSRVQLQGGLYTFESVSFEPQSTLMLGNPLELTTLHIAGDFTWRGSIESTNESPTLAVVSLGNQITIDRDLAAGVLAPNALLRIAPETRTAGAFFGRRVDIEAGATVSGEPFPWATVPGVEVPSRVAGDPLFLDSEGNEPPPVIGVPFRTNGPVLEFDNTSGTTFRLTHSLRAFDPDGIRERVDFEEGGHTFTVFRRRSEETLVPCAETDRTCLFASGIPLQDVELALSYRTVFREIPGAQGLVPVSVAAELRRNGNDFELLDFQVPEEGQRFGVVNAPDCKQRAMLQSLFEIPDDMPPVNFPDFESCTDAQCEQVARAWIRLHHNAWRLAQMFSFLDENPRFRVQYWNDPGDQPNGDPLPASAPAYWFGPYTDSSYRAIREAVMDYWSLIRTNRNGRVQVDLSCPTDPPRVGCSTGAHGAHAVKGTVALCRPSFEQESFLLDTLQHEPLHHIFVNYKGVVLPLKDNVLDTHANPLFCLGTNRLMLFENFARQIRDPSVQNPTDPDHTHFRDDRTCGHRRKLLLTVEVYAWFGRWLGRFIREGQLVRWPQLPPLPTSPPTCRDDVGCLCTDVAVSTPPREPDGDFSVERFCEDSEGDNVCVRQEFSSGEAGICQSCDDLRGPGCPCGPGDSCERGECFGANTQDGRGQGTCYETPPPSFACLADCQALLSTDAAICYADGLGGPRCLDPECSRLQSDDCIREGLVCRSGECVTECLEDADCTDLGYPPGLFACLGNRCVDEF